MTFRDSLTHRKKKRSRALSRIAAFTIASTGDIFDCMFFFVVVVKNRDYTEIIGKDRGQD